MSDIGKKLVHGFAWEAATRTVVQVASWISTIWVARLLTPDDYGLVGLSGIYTGLCLMFSNMGLGSALVSCKEINVAHKNNIFWAGALLATAFFCFLFFLAPFIAGYYAIEELTEIIRVAGLMVLISPLGIVPQALLARDLKFKTIALIRLVGSSVLITSTLLLAFNGYGYWSLVYSTVLSEVVLVTLSFVNAKFIPTTPRNLSGSKPLFLYGINLLGARLTDWLNSNWIMLFSGHYYGKTITGYYQFSRTISSLPMGKIGRIFSSLAFPVFSKIQQDKTQARSYFLGLQKYLFILIAPMFVGLSITAPQFVPVLLGEKWIAIIEPVQILCLTNILAGSAILMPAIFEGLGRPDISFGYQVRMAIMMPLALLIGARWGLNGMLISYALVLPIGYFYLLKELMQLLRLDFRAYLKNLIGPLVASLVMVVAVRASQFFYDASGLLQELMANIVVGVAVYLFVFMLGWPEDVRKVFSLIRRR